MEMTMDTDQWEQPVEMSTAEESYGDASAAEAVTVNDAGQIVRETTRQHNLPVDTKKKGQWILEGFSP
ncbi:hypothetical protein AtubIFM57143_003972 [Aspergillus tubingensis]|nr:hypothetical protein AtubIFM57143_003972 [Aspergillus tubingensis]